jgi:hypothetical protein
LELSDVELDNGFLGLAEYSSGVGRLAELGGM